MKPNRRIAAMFLFAAIPFLAAPSCQKKDSPPPPPNQPLQVAGLWGGSWSSDDMVSGGRAWADVQQAYDVITGTVELDSSCFFGPWPASGYVGPDQVHMSMAWAVQIDLQVVDEDTLQGRYAVYAGPPSCLGDQGSIMLQRQ